MSAPLAHLYALALRTLETQERRAAELRGRLAPVLAAGGLGATLLAAPALGALAAGGPWCGVVLILTVAGLVVTVSAGVRLLVAEDVDTNLWPAAVRRTLDAHDALRSDAAFYDAMIGLVEAKADLARRQADVLHRHFTVVTGGILFVLCGLALAALVA